MFSYRRAVLVVAVLIATLWRDRDYAAASPQELTFADSPNRPACNCVRLQQCPSLNPSSGSRLNREQIAVLQRARCGYEGRNIKVCCPDNGSRSTNTVEPPRDCGLSSDFDKIHGGTNAPLGAHPWMVALGYKSTTFGGGSSIVRFDCGGVLVTSRHVITAAHCVSPNHLRQLLTQLNVGDWNIATDPDCQTSERAQSTVCAPPAVVRRAFRVTVHPEYNTNLRHNNDIAVIQLDQEVPFGPYVYPICIPESFDPRIRDSSKHSLPLATGWGRTKNGSASNILQEVRLPFVDIQVCNASWAGSLGPGQVCAGGEPGKDTCGGDSGGPLVVTGKDGPPFSLIGLTSFGQLLCGNKDNYGVYTSVAYYRNWILSSLTV